MWYMINEWSNDRNIKFPKIREQNLKTVGFLLPFSRSITEMEIFGETI